MNTRLLTAWLFNYYDHAKAPVVVKSYDNNSRTPFSHVAFSLLLLGLLSAFGSVFDMLNFNVGVGVNYIKIYILDLKI